MKLSKPIDVQFVIDILRNDELVWSADFDAIRLPLADLIVSMSDALNAASEIVASVGSEYPVALPGCKCGGKCGKVC